jgi:hypothetical protein
MDEVSADGCAGDNATEDNADKARSGGLGGKSLVGDFWW